MVTDFFARLKQMESNEISIQNLSGQQLEEIMQILYRKTLSKYTASNFDHQRSEIEQMIDMGYTVKT